jgi:DNA-binding MarR family transcriptional regulator
MLRSSVKNLPRFVKMILRQCDISELKLDINKTQTNILMSVDENSDKSMSEISQMTGLEKSSFTRSVDYLVMKGFLVRNFSDHDRRKVVLSLTAKGARAAKLIRKELDEYMQSLLADFSDNEKAEFLGSLNVLSNYIDRILEKR